MTGMRLGVIADVHGNEVALRAVLADAAGCRVDRWWVLGDLVLFGPRPAEAVGLLRSLPGVEMLSGNTDRYVLTGDQPAPHATAADAAGDTDLVERYGLVAAGIGWARGALAQAGVLDALAGLPGELRLKLADGTRLLGVHASPASDDGTGIKPGLPDDELAALLSECDADIVIGGHTHRRTDRVIGPVRALNPGSVGVPERPGEADWLLLEFDESQGSTAPVRVDHRTAPFDADAVVRDLRARLHPNADFFAAILTGKRKQIGH